MPEERPDEEIYRAQVRAVMCFSMSMCLSIWHKGRIPRLTEHETQKSVAMGRLSLQCYGTLASAALGDEKLLY